MQLDNWVNKILIYFSWHPKTSQAIILYKINSNILAESFSKRNFFIENGDLTPNQLGSEPGTAHQLRDFFRIFEVPKTCTEDGFSKTCTGDGFSTYLCCCNEQLNLNTNPLSITYILDKFSKTCTEYRFSKTCIEDRFLTNFNIKPANNISSVCCSNSKQHVRIGLIPSYELEPTFSTSTPIFT